MSPAERRQHSAVIVEILEVPPLPGLVVTRSRCTFANYHDSHTAMPLRPDPSLLVFHVRRV